MYTYLPVCMMYNKQYKVLSGRRIKWPSQVCAIITSKEIFLPYVAIIDYFTWLKSILTDY